MSGLKEENNLAEMTDAHAPVSITAWVDVSPNWTVLQSCEAAGSFSVMLAIVVVWGVEMMGWCSSPDIGQKC